MNDIMVAYRDLHDLVPETRPTIECDDGSRNVLTHEPPWFLWVNDRDADRRVHLGYSEFDGLAICRCAALTWAAKEIERLYNARPLNMEVDLVRDCLIDWMDDGADDDLRLINRCKRIYEAGGK